MNWYEWWWSVLLLAAVWAGEASSPRCYLHNAHNCLTGSREEPGRQETAYVKRCQGARDVPPPFVQGAQEVEWLIQPVVSSCGSKGGKKVQQRLDSSFFLQTDDNNVVQLMTREMVTRDYCLGVMFGGQEEPQAEDEQETRVDNGWEIGAHNVSPSASTVAEGGSNQNVTDGTVKNVLTLMNKNGQPDPVPEYIVFFCRMDPDDQISRDRELCTLKPCVRKCCPRGKFFQNDICIYVRNITEMWTPQVSSWSLGMSSDLEIADNLPFDSYDKNCYADDQKKTLFESGELKVSGIFMDPEDYCIDFEEHEDTVREVAQLCPQQDACNWKSEVLDPVLMAVSCVFLAATAMVYITVAELRRTSYSHCFIPMIITLFIKSILILILLFTRNILKQDKTLCLATAFVNLMFVLSSYFWLNVVCFDIWWTLTSRSYGVVNKRKMFFKYGLYAWGCPLLLGTMALLLDIIEDATYLQPKFYEGSCWFYNNVSRWAYKNSIILILLVINCGFFLHIVFVLGKKLDNSDINNANSRSTRNNNRWKTFGRLFIVMGVVWILEVPSPFAPWVECVWWRVLFDTITKLQGVVIFLVSVCNKEKRRMVQNRFSSHYTSRSERTLSTSLRATVMTLLNRNGRTYGQDNMASAATENTVVKTTDLKDTSR
ncbi:G-protein coupled receptor Mth-like [Homarus americanus]|uniref:G-protein coupled receptor Mth-like n=1 Tax=Homarus americanus TaxID=6706 RepID=UPI001C447B90|nr:G-protein coupled receptor Mth-like [Homarus americanus]